jgi:hypothetical protein
MVHCGFGGVLLHGFNISFAYFSLFWCARCAWRFGRWWVCVVWWLCNVYQASLDALEEGRLFIEGIGDCADVCCEGFELFGLFGSMSSLRKTKYLSSRDLVTRSNFLSNMFSILVSNVLSTDCRIFSSVIRIFSSIIFWMASTERLLGLQRLFWCSFLEAFLPCPICFHSYC